MIFSRGGGGGVPLKKEVFPHNSTCDYYRLWNEKYNKQVETFRVNGEAYVVQAEREVGQPDVNI